MHSLIRPFAILSLLVLLLATGCTQQRALARKHAVDAGASPHIAPAMPQRVFRLGNQSNPTFLIVLLHGYGGSGDDLASVARRWAAGLPGAAIVLPDGVDPFEHGGDGRQWYSLEGAGALGREQRLRPVALALSSWVDAELDRLHLARDRVVISGFSQGAILSEWLAVFRRPVPLATVAFSGMLAVDEPVAESRTTAAVLLVHGTEDGRIPSARSDEARTALVARGARVELVMHAGGHTISPADVEAGMGFIARQVGSSVK